MRISRRKYFTLFNAMSDACQRLAYVTDALNEAVEYLREAQLKTEGFTMVDYDEPIAKTTADIGEL